MSNPIEVPENIIALAKKILEDSTCYGDNSLELAGYIALATRPENEVEPFMVYKVQVRGFAEPRMGFRVSKDVLYPWVVLDSHSSEKEDAFPVSHSNTIHSSDDITVIERWAGAGIKFGITEDDAVTGTEVVIRGSVRSDGVDSDGDVFVTTSFGDGVSSGHHFAAADVALLNESNNN